MEQQKQQQELPKKIRYFFGLGDITCDLTGSFKNYYWTFFLTSIMGVNLAVTAIISTLTYAGDMICSFISGIITDAFKPGKWGKYRKVLIVTTVIASVGYIGMWACPLIPQTGIMAVLTVVSAVIFSVFITIATTANSAIISIIGRNEAEKGLLMSHRWAYQKVSGLSVAYIIAGVMALVSMMGSNQSAPYVITGILFAVLYIIGYGFHFKLAKGYDITESDMKTQARLTLKDMIQALIVNKHLIQVAAANIFTTMCGMLYSMMAAFVWNYGLMKGTLLTPYLTVTNAFAMIGGIVAGMLIKKYEVRNIAIIATGTNCILMLIAYLFFKQSFIGIWIIMAIVMFNTSLNYTSLLTLYTSCATYSEWKTGKKANAVIVGISNIPIKIAMLIAGIIIPAVLASVGFDAKAAVVAPNVSLGLMNAFLLLPSICWGIACIIQILFFKLKKEDVAKYQNEIDARNS